MNDMPNVAQMKHRAEGLQFLSLAKTQRRLSWTYRYWAMEAEQHGKRDLYLKWGGEARRLWRDAKYHLKVARRHLHG